MANTQFLSFQKLSEYFKWSLLPGLKIIMQTWELFTDVDEQELQIIKVQGENNFTNLRAVYRCRWTGTSDHQGSRRKTFV